MIHALSKSKKTVFQFWKLPPNFKDTKPKWLFFIRNDFVFKMHVSCQLEIKQHHLAFVYYRSAAFYLSQDFNATALYVTAVFWGFHRLFLATFRGPVIHSASLVCLFFCKAGYTFWRKWIYLRCRDLETPLRWLNWKNSEVLCLAHVLLLFLGKIVLYIYISSHTSVNK